MSSTLMWRLLVKDGESLPDELKRVISRKIWDTDGSCGNGEAILDSSWISYLEGLQDAGVKGASELIEAINKHMEVVVWHEH